MPDGFRINKRGLDKFTRELNKELQRSAKRNIKPMTMSTEASAGGPGWAVPPAQPTTVVNGPTFYGDVTGQVAWNNSGPVHQHQHLPSGLTATDITGLADLAHELLTALAEAPDDGDDDDDEVSVATAEARAVAAPCGPRRSRPNPIPAASRR